MHRSSNAGGLSPRAAKSLLVHRRVVRCARYPAGKACSAGARSWAAIRVWRTALVARATGIATSTIQRGLRELTADEPLAGGRTRRAGGGRKRAIDLDATLLRDLDALVEPTAPGDPDSPLGGRARAHGRWRWRSTVWATASATRRRVVDWATACRATPRLVRAAASSGREFRYIARRVEPTISVDTKKKELVRSRTRAAPSSPCDESPASQRRLGECRDRSRHREYGRSSQPWVARRTRPVAVDHGGCRRELGAPPVVQVGTTIEIITARI